MWNHNECRYECKENCKNNYMRNPITCDYESDKACKIKEYVDIKHCSCEKPLNGKLTYQKTKTKNSGGPLRTQDPRRPNTLED